MRKTGRNKKLTKDYLKGMSIPQLCTKYDVTPKRVYEIIRLEGVTPNRNNQDVKTGGDK